MIAWVAVLLACTIPPDPAYQETTARDAYFLAWCRVYTEPLCVRDQLHQCGWDHSFADRTGCMNWMRFRIAQCQGANDYFVANEAQVNLCVSQLQAFQCGTDPFCVGSQPTFDGGDCEPITTFLNDQCPDGAGG